MFPPGNHARRKHPVSHTLLHYMLLYLNSSAAHLQQLRAPALKGGPKIQNALVGRSPEGEADILKGLHKPPVHQHVNHGQHPVRIAAPGPAVPQKVLFQGIPDTLLTCRSVC